MTVIAILPVDLDLQDNEVAPLLGVVQEDSGMLLPYEFRQPTIAVQVARLLNNDGNGDHGVAVVTREGMMVEDIFVDGADKNQPGVLWCSWIDE